MGLHLLVTRQEGVLFLKDQGVLVQEIASVRVSFVFPIESCVCLTLNLKSRTFEEAPIGCVIRSRTRV